MEERDSFDHKILVPMVVDARRTGDELSEAIGLSSAACLCRLQRLRKIGVSDFVETYLFQPPFDGLLSLVGLKELAKEAAV